MCLVVTGSIAAWGVFSRHYDDTLLQRIGLSGVAIACILRVPEKIANPYTPPELLLAQVSLCVYAIGTVLKIAHREHSGRRHFHRRKTDIELT